MTSFSIKFINKTFLHTFIRKKNY